MESRTKLDPFHYDAWSIVTTILQVASVVIGVVLSLNGNHAGLLGLGALAGGARGDLVRDLAAVLKKNLLLSLMVFLIVLGLPACGTGISKQFLKDSVDAVQTNAGEYLVGCQMITVAPAFSVDWTSDVTYGGGLFVGCSEQGHLAEFRCYGLLDDETMKTRIQCDPLSQWERKETEP